LERIFCLSNQVPNVASLGVELSFHSDLRLTSILIVIVLHQARVQFLRLGKIPMRGSSLSGLMEHLSNALSHIQRKLVPRIFADQQAEVIQRAVFKRYCEM